MVPKYQTILIYYFQMILLKHIYANAISLHLINTTKLNKYLKSKLCYSLVHYLFYLVRQNTFIVIDLVQLVEWDIILL